MYNYIYILIAIGAVLTFALILMPLFTADWSQPKQYPRIYSQPTWCSRCRTNHGATCPNAEWPE